METIFEACAYVGIIIISFKVFSLLLSLRSLFRKKQNLLKKYGTENGKTWAVITGATDGIGKGFALVLSDYGFNICLVSRTKSKLDKTAQEIKSRNPTVDLLSIQADFSTGNNTIFYDKICEHLKGLDVAILVNNVGIRDNGPLERSSPQDIIDIITVNCFPQALMTHLMSQKLATRKSRSAIINISSFMSTTPFSWGALYCSTKVFNHYHSKSIAMELEQNIDVLSLKPLYVCTNMTSQRKGIEVINIEECAEGCLRHLGFEKTTYGHWKHQLQGWILEKIVKCEFVFINLWRLIGKREMSKDSSKNVEFLKHK